MIVHGDSLALDATLVEASSVFGPGWDAENALDGDTNSNRLSAPAFRSRRAERLAELTSRVLAVTPRFARLP